MSFFKRAKEVTADIASASKRQAQRGKLEVEVRRLESKVSSEQDAIGHALFPLFEAGTLQVDSAEVQEHMTAIRELLGEIAEKRTEMEGLRSKDEREENQAESITHIEANAAPEAAAEQSAQDAWASEGGITPEQGGQV
jgi:hypothetical protein